MSKAIHLANLGKKVAKSFLKSPAQLSILPTEQQKRYCIFLFSIKNLI
jgi:hypothetical protein